MMLVVDQKKGVTCTRASSKISFDWWCKLYCFNLIWTRTSFLLLFVTLACNLQNKTTETDEYDSIKQW